MIACIITDLISQLLFGDASMITDCTLIVCSELTVCLLSRSACTVVTKLCFSWNTEIQDVRAIFEILRRGVEESMG